MKKALIYSPYFDTVGGGEVYSLNFGLSLHQLGYQVHLAWPDSSLVKLAQKRLGLDISKFIFDPQAHQTISAGGVVSKYLFTRNFDISFFVSDGSIPFLFSRQNYLHFQVPFTFLSSNFVTKLKLSQIKQIICNSKFTKKVIDKKLKTKTQVVYPPVNFSTKPAKKNNYILSVGRFTDALHNKRQDVLVTVFKNMIDQGLTGWELILAGSSKEGGNFLQQIIEDAKGCPISIQTDVTSNKLESLYNHAKIFWLATGYGIDQSKNPEKVEHFGISTVEAMSAGAVPVVINKGGQPEIVSDGQNGFLFDDIKKLEKITLNLIKNPQKLAKISTKSQQIVTKFNQEIFNKQVVQLVNS